MREYHDRDEQLYSRTNMKQKFMDHYVDGVRFQKVLGIEIIVMSQRKAEKIKNKFYKDLSRESVEEVKLRVIQTGVQLIREAIKSVKEVHTGENYPSVNSTTLWNTDLFYLKRFLSCLITIINQSGKIAAIGHFIMQATFARTLIINNRMKRIWGSFTWSFSFQIFSRYIMSTWML